MITTILLIILISFAVVFFVLFLLDKKKTYRQMLTYIDVMSGTGDIVKSLEDAQGMFRKQSVAYLAIDEALFYLRTSIMRDYETAFQIIEKCFGQQEIKKMHEVLLQHERDKIVYLLTG